MIAHQSAGSGEPVVLLNGGMMTMAAWDAIAIPLAADYRVIRCDFCGQLLSPGTHSTLEAHAADVREVLDWLGVARAHVIGTSFGALVGTVLAADYPERVSSLVIGTATERVTDEAWRETEPFFEACRAAASGTGDKGAIVDLLFPLTFSDAFRQSNGAMLAGRRALVAMMPSTYFDGLAAIVALLRGLDLRPRLVQIRCRTLVIAAEDDRTFPLAHSRAIAAAAHGASLEIVTGAAHGVFFETPERVLPLLQAHLKG